MLINRIGQHPGNYRLIRLLGKGGFAEVYLGEHLYLKNYVAIKMLLTSVNDEKEQLFLSEAQTLARLTHPNIIRVREFAVESGIPYLVMDYAPAGTLRDRYPKGARLSLTMTATYIKQIATALQYAHNLDIIHRDVKPENILLGLQQQAMLSDFSISLLSPSPTMPTNQALAGTFPYMAPEQWLEKACFASDQYALGIVAYEWLCGIRPFEGTALFQQHLSVPPPRLREKDPSLPEAVEAVVLKALAKQPEDRYVSVLIFARALEKACGIAPDHYPETPGTSIADHPGDAPAGVSRRVFLAASPENNAFTAHLKADLEIRDIFVEETSQTEYDEEQTRRAIRAAQVLLVLLSPQARSAPMLTTQLRIAELYRRRVIYLRAADDAVQEWLPPGAEKATIIDARGTAYKQALTEIATCVEREIKPHVELPTPAPAFEPRNPYKGLHAFTQDDARDFFGRDTLVQEMVTTLVRVLNVSSLPGIPGKRLLAVVGPSGSGKSSAIMAGLMPRLQQGVLSSSETWTYLDPMVPGQHPLDALAYALLARFPGKSLQDVRDVLSKNGVYGLHQLATFLVQQPGARIVLLIDQLEELFSPETTEAERQQFIDLLVAAANEPGGPVIVLLTLRADFYDRPFAYPALGQLIQQQQCAVLPMKLDDLRAVIERPTTLPDVWLTFEDNLVGDILFEMQGQVEALPLLEFALDQLFQRRRGHLLTSQAYREIGGVKGALAKHAEDTYAALPSDEHRGLARALFLRLITTGHDSSRRRAPLAEFMPGNSTQAQRMQETIEAFLAARLLTTNQMAGVTTLEISHEALIREWARLKDWKDRAQEDMRLQQMLSNDVAEWESRGKPRDRLYRRSRSKEFKTWREHNLISKQEAAFLKASARWQTTTRIGLAAIVLLILALVLPTIFYFRQLAMPGVTNLNDNGPGSLRQAIDAAAPDSTITFDSSLHGTIHLTSILDITRNLTIEGPGANVLTIKLDTVVVPSLEREILIDPGVTVHITGLAFKDSTTQHFVDNHGTLTLDKCVFSGNVIVGNYSSVLIFNQGALTISNSTISGNTLTGQSGSIYNSGTLIVNTSIISGNTLKPGTPADAFGGGIFNSKGAASVNDSIISGNKVIAIAGKDALGGGISNDGGGSVTVIRSTISNNVVISSQKAYGGGIYSQKGGKLTILASTISGNRTSASGNSNLSLEGAIGGGIYIEGIFDNSGNTIVSQAQFTLSNSTLFNNSITTDKGTSRGGGITAIGVLGTITFCTIYGNTAPSPGSVGGGMRASGDPTLHNQLILKNSLVGNNSASGDSDISGTVITNGHNFVQNVSGATFTDPLHLHATDLSGAAFATLRIDPQLKNNGGPTQTLALLAGSPAIDQVPLAFCGSTTDQRGVKRPQGPACDMGAYEYVPPK